MDKRRHAFVVDEHGVRRLTEVDEHGRPKRAPTPRAERLNQPPRAQHPHMGLWQACLARGGPTFEDADDLAQELGVAAATALVRECGPRAPMAALAARVYGRGGQTPA